MAVYKIFPSQDATLYSAYPAMNTGIDEILEASTNFKTGVTETNGEYPQASRGGAAIAGNHYLLSWV